MKKVCLQTTILFLVKKKIPIIRPKNLKKLTTPSGTSNGKISKRGLSPLSKRIDNQSLELAHLRTIIKERPGGKSNKRRT